MPWLTIIMALLSFFLSKKSGMSTGAALGTAALVGGATYAVTHYTDWGQTNLGQFDGVTPDATDLAADPTQAPAVTTPPFQGGGGAGLNLPGLTGLLPIAGGAIAGATLGRAIPTWVWIAGAGVLALIALK